MTDETKVVNDRRAPRDFGPEEQKRANAAAIAFQAAEFLLTGLAVIFGDPEEIKADLTKSRDEWAAMIATADETGVEPVTDAEREAFQELSDHYDEAINKDFGQLLSEIGGEVDTAEL